MATIQRHDDITDFVKFEDGDIKFKLNLPPKVPEAPPEVKIPHWKLRLDNNTAGNANDPSNLPFSEPSISGELNFLHTLKQSQLDLNSPMMKHLSGTRNKVTYFSQATVQYNNDNISITAPGGYTNNVRYNCIYNMIILLESELSSSFEIDEGIVRNEITSSAFMFPGIEPQPHDLFYINESVKEGVLYCVTNVSPVASLKETGWHIEYARFQDQLEPSQLKQLVIGEYVFNFEAIGTNTRVILEKSLSDIYKTLQSIKAKVSNEFLSRFFSNEENIIYYKCIPYYIKGSKLPFFTDLLFGDKIFKRKTFDPYLTHFFTIAFKDKIQYKGFSIFPINPFWIGEDFIDKYKYSIFNAIKCRNPSLLKYMFFNVLEFRPKTIKDITYQDWCYFDISDENSGYLVDIYPKTFLRRIKANKPYKKIDSDKKKKDYTKYNLFINFINDKSYIPTKDELLELSKNIELMSDREVYGISPLLLYICHYYELLISNKSY